MFSKSESVDYIYRSAVHFTDLDLESVVYESHILIEI